MFRVPLFSDEPGPSTVQPKSKRIRNGANKSTNLENSAIFSSSSSDVKSQPEDSSSTSSDLIMSTSHTIETSERNPESTSTSNNEDEPGSSGGIRQTGTSVTTRLNRFSGRNYRQKQQVTTSVTSETDEELEDIFNKSLSQDMPMDGTVSDEIVVPPAETNPVDVNVAADDTTTSSDTSSESDNSDSSEDHSFIGSNDSFVLAVASNTEDEVSWLPCEIHCRMLLQWILTYFVNKHISNQVDSKIWTL